MTDYDKILRSDGQVSMDGSANAATYDAWAGDYDRELAEWGYEAPDRAAEYLAKHLDDSAGARVLDCGCGTGMTGVKVAFIADLYLVGVEMALQGRANTGNTITHEG